MPVCVYYRPVQLDQPGSRGEDPAVHGGHLQVRVPAGRPRLQQALGGHHQRPPGGAHAVRDVQEARAGRGRRLGDTAAVSAPLRVLQRLLVTLDVPAHTIVCS